MTRVSSAGITDVCVYRSKVFINLKFFIKHSFLKNLRHAFKIGNRKMCRYMRDSLIQEKAWLE